MTRLDHTRHRRSRRDLLRAGAVAGIVLGVRSGDLRAAAGAQGGDALRTVASFSILADWVANVGGEHIALSTIVPAGGDAHTFDPDPSQVASIGDARLIFAIGAGFEPWLADMIDASGSDAVLVEVSRGLALLDGAAHEDEHADEEDHGHDGAQDEHDHAGADPHIWGDVANAIAAVETIRAALAEADPAHADAYRANADAYVAALDELDAWIRERVRTIPEERRKLVTSHDTLRYYAHAYGFEILGTALGSQSTEAGDPAAGEIAALVAAIEEAGVPAIFAENVANPDLMRAIAEEAGVELAPPLLTDALGEEGSRGDTYIGMMRANTETIVAALGGA